jgi:hypothetical protein
MNWYSADIGTWERGRTVRFQARNHEEAFKVAEAYGEVVQLRAGADPLGENANDGLGETIWDWMNLVYDRKRWTKD